MAGLEKQFQDNEITGHNWTSDQSAVSESCTKDVGGDDQINEGPEYSMTPPNPSVPSAGQAIEIAEDGGPK